LLFNSLEFAIFLPIAFLIYWFAIRRFLELQNIFLVAASYVFYGYWDYRFLSLIIFSSALDFLIGAQLAETESERKRKVLLIVSLVVNLGFLGFFKYYDFFVDSFVDSFTFLGMPFDVDRLNIILPVGISFYTFQTLSYTIDVYNRRLTPTKDPVAFFAFVSFFPQLVAGPIERAKDLLPQFYVKRNFDYQEARDGMRQILWGLFKKVVVADNCAVIVNEVYGNVGNAPPSMLLIAVVLFAFQIYGDFSGYSDIAIGTSRLFGFKLKQNFAFPYFSRDIAEFWRRWHISLSSWFKDYLYIPLGGSRGSTLKKVRNTFIIFVVSGFWHGANWTFVAWGFLNALYFLPLLLAKRNRANTDVVAEGRYLPSMREAIQVLFTFFITVLAWVFFRADSISQGLVYIADMLSGLALSPKQVLIALDHMSAEMVTYYILLLLLFEWLGRHGKHALESFQIVRVRAVRWLIYYALFMMVIFENGKEIDFIYFQF
jgi:D-alanyl-lipoteichoic acid acyltransferase DltB (MBOAT superfamily)